MRILTILFTCTLLYSCSYESKKVNNFLSELENITDTIYKIDESSLIVIIKKDSTILESYEYILNKKSILDTINNTIATYEYKSPDALGGKWTEYYSNGKIKVKGQSTDKFGCWMNNGDFEYYDSDGILLRKLTYDNWLKKNSDGCHLTIVDMKLIEYYKNGNIKAEKKYQSGYEDMTFDEFYNNSEWENEYKSGKWKFYNQNGKVIKKEEYKIRWKKGNT